MEYLFKERITTLTGDITKLDVSAIVNAANSSLMGGGGVDGAIHRAGGPEIIEECKKIRSSLYPDGMPAGNAVITRGGYLKAKYVIHTVGPVWRGGKSGEEAVLRQAYLNSLETAAENNLESVAFPAISTGIYGFPKGLAATIAFDTAKKFAEENSFPKKVIFVFFSERDREIFLKANQAEKSLG